VKVMILGATGMVGQGLLRECLLDPEVETVVTIGRHTTQGQHVKLQEIVQSDFFNLSPIEGRLRGYDACFFCLGVSSVGMKEEAYRRVTYDLTMSVARVKGRTENALLQMPFMRPRSVLSVFAPDT
jgi:putative NADH-flavin reductase